MNAKHCIAMGLIASFAGHAAAQEAIVGLITKTETNPFFVKMKEGAQRAAKLPGAKLLTAAGKSDGDNAGQVTAIENMVSAGAKAILITPSDAKAIVPAIKRAREQGVLVIALDSPADPVNATDALFATDNFKAGQLIGQYAKASLGGKPAKIATLDLFPGHPVGIARHNGFLAGYGVPGIDAKTIGPAKSAEVVCMADSYGASTSMRATAFGARYRWRFSCSSSSATAVAMRSGSSSPPTSSSSRPAKPRKTSPSCGSAARCSASSCWPSRRSSCPTGCCSPSASSSSSPGSA